MTNPRDLHRTTLILAALAAILTAATGSAASLRHTHLIKSEPSNNDTLAVAPKAVKLWFTEQVELGITTVKLASSTGTSIALGAVARPDTGKAAPVVATIAQALAPGAYQIDWSTAALDGHPAKGTIAFVVRSAK
jgi:methionine-rich copper-binding protein CopC